MTFIYLLFPITLQVVLAQISMCFTDQQSLDTWHEKHSACAEETNNDIRVSAATRERQAYTY